MPERSATSIGSCPVRSLPASCRSAKGGTTRPTGRTRSGVEWRMLDPMMHAADIQHRYGKRACSDEPAPVALVECVFVDGGYAGELLAPAKDKTNIVVETARRTPSMKGFVVMRRRWVVERTRAWIMECRPRPRPRTSHRRCRVLERHRRVRRLPVMRLGPSRARFWQTRDVWP